VTPPRVRSRWGIAIRALLLAATLATAVALISFARGRGRGVLAAAGGIKPSTWTILAGAWLAWLALEYARFASLLSLLGFRLRPWLGAQLTFASYFVSSLTPTAELHVPTMAWMLRREGLAAPLGAAAALVKSLYMTFWVCVVGLGTLSLEGDVVLPAAVAVKVRVAAIWLLVPGAFFAALLLRPERVRAWAATRASRSSGWRGRLFAGFGRAAESVAALGRSAHPLHLACHLASLASIFVYAGAGCIAAEALGFDLPWPRVSTVFASGLVIAYLAPVPGSIGVTEVTTAYLLDPSLSTQAVTAAVVLRGLFWYLPAVLGGAVLWVWALRRDGPATAARAASAAPGPDGA
jgi:glycosyltransferase 2 family protein